MMVALQSQFRFIGMAFWFVAGAALAPAQNTWIVDHDNGPGTNFTELIPAIAAASPGDRILVHWRSDGLAYELPTTLRKPLSILGVRSSAGVQPAMWGSSAITDIPFGSTLLVHDFIAGGYDTVGGQLFSLSFFADRCEGMVLFDRLEAVSAGEINAEESGMVSVSNSELFGHWEMFSRTARPEDSRSHLVASNTRLTGIFIHRRAAIFNQSVFTALLNCEVRGAPGGVRPDPLNGCWSFNNNGGVGVDLAGGTPSFLSGDTTTVGGISIGCGSGGSARQGWIMIDHLSTPAPGFFERGVELCSVSPGPVVSGRTADIEVFAPTGQPVVIFASTGIDREPLFVEPPPPILGEIMKPQLLLDRSTAFPMVTVPVPGRRTTIQIQVPGTVEAGTVVWLQGVAFGPQGELTPSPAVPIVVGEY